MCTKGDYLYIYNYTKYDKKEPNKTIEYNLIEYNFKTRIIEDTYNLTKMLNSYYSEKKYKYININAMYYYKNDLYLMPRRFFDKNGNEIYNRNIILVIKDKISEIKLSKKIPKKYTVVDMEIYKNKIYFVASKEEIAVNDKKIKTFGSIIFVTDIQGKLLTEFINYDLYNKYEGITINRHDNDFLNNMINY